MPGPAEHERPRSIRAVLERHSAKLALSLALGAGLAWLLVRGGLPILPPDEAFSRTEVLALGPYLALVLGMHFFRAYRWRHLLAPVGDVPRQRVLAVSWVAFAAILLAPFRTGEVVRPLLVARRGDVRIPEATGTCAAERVVDGLAMSAILWAALALAPRLDPLPTRFAGLPLDVSAVPSAARSALVLFAAAFAAMAAFYRNRALASRLVRRGAGLVSPRLGEALAGLFTRLAGGLASLPRPGLLLPFFAETALYWAANALSIWVLGRAVGLEGLGLAQAAVVMGCIGLGVLVPSGPGHFGVFQLSAFVALAMFFPEPVVTSAGAAFVFLHYATQVVVHLAAAAAAFALDPGLWRSLSARAG